MMNKLTIVTANELALAFPPRNLPKKFRPDPSTFYLVIVVTNKRTDRQTYAGDYIIPRKSFRGDNNYIKRHFVSLLLVFMHEMPCHHFSDSTWTTIIDISSNH